MAYRSRMQDQATNELWRACAIFLLLMVISFGIALTVVTVLLVQTMEELEGSVITGSSSNATFMNPTPLNDLGAIEEIPFDLSEPINPGLFSDLTESEIQTVNSYLFSIQELNLTKASEAEINEASIFSLELMLPLKSEALQYLADPTQAPPPRWAKAVIFQGNRDIPEVFEYRVGPLPNPNSYQLVNYGSRRRNPVPFAIRPIGKVEVRDLTKSAIAQAFIKLAPVIAETTRIVNCSDCVTITMSPVSTSLEGNYARKSWIGLNFQTEFLTLHPIDLQVLLEHNGKDTKNYRLTSVWYNQRFFDSIDIFLAEYQNGTVEKFQSPFPEGPNKSFSTMNLRLNILESESKRPPRQFEPDGKRYTVKHQKVDYLGWSFNYRMSTRSGPMLLNVKYRGERIAYELSLQEVAVIYSANNPLRRFSNYVDSFDLLGRNSRLLVPGADCPQHATLLLARHFTDWSDSSELYPYAFCLFEQTTGMPIRRHHSSDTRKGNFYSGMMDDVLVLRSILTIGNYDYIIDYVFHQNGVLEVKAVSTGYIVASVYSTNENKYGFRLHNSILGNIHHHMFHFKVDIDINGVQNRFETLDIQVEETPNAEYSSNSDSAFFSQIIFKKTLMERELDAAYKYNFETPKYLLFHNENEKDRFGNDRAYRIAIQGMSKQTLPEGEGHEPAISWSRYQLAVTKYNRYEETSSSVYSLLDAVDPVVNFQSYLDNNDTIVDQDLVAWVTMGVHHIPHTEDLPVTTTPGGHLQFFLLPYNYFEEDPSMASKSATRIDIDSSSGNPEVKINRYGLKPDVSFLPKYVSNFDSRIKNDSSSFFGDG